MSNINLANQTSYIAQFVVRKGEQTIARLPGVESGGSLSVPTTDSYTVVAQTILAGNLYTSKPMTVTAGKAFKAQVLQSRAQGTYEFDVIESNSSNASTMEFQKTSIAPVTFKIWCNGVAVQEVVVEDSFTKCSIHVGDTFYIQAVINGVTTEVYETTNPNQSLTAVADTSDLESGYFTLVA